MQHVVNCGPRDYNDMYIHVSILTSIPNINSVVCSVAVSSGARHDHSCPVLVRHHTHSHSHDSAFCSP